MNISFSRKAEPGDDTALCGSALDLLYMYIHVRLAYKQTYIVHFMYMYMYMYIQAVTM